MFSTGLLLALAAAALGFAVDARLAPRIRDLRSRERLTNLVCGFGRYVVHFLFQGAMLAVYAACHALAPAPLPVASPGTWLLAFVLADVLTWLGHLAAHRVPLLWAIHSVHHQPVEMDVTVGLRTHLLTSFVYFPFALPLALAGVPPLVYLAVTAGRLVVMALTHTRIRTPRWLDPVLVTPEIHAVHHSADPRHYGKNLGGILMLWDHLFGTWLPRQPVARCGLPGPQARDALDANLLPLRQLVGRAPSR